jgi:hypothetical protein
MSGDLRYSVSLEDLPETEEQKPTGWDVVGGRIQTLPGENEIEVGYEPEPEAAGVEIEIESPRRGRGVEIDSDVADELQRLRAQKEASDQRANAAVAVVTLKDHKTTLERSFQEAEEYRRQAQAQYADAANSFDHDRAVAALAQVTAAERHKEECDRAYREIEAQEAHARQYAAQQPQAVSDPFDAWVDAANLREEDKAYLRQRKEFVQAHPDNGVLLQSAANIAEKRHGLIPGTQEYHDHIDREVGLADADNVPPPVRQAKRQKGGASRRPPAAPGSRSTASSPQSQVFLSDFDLKTAKELGISPRDYAKNYKERATKGQLSRADAAGRLHATYTYNDSY